MDSGVLASEEWQIAVAGMIRALATDDFYPSLAKACELITACDSSFVVWLSRDHRPIVLYDDLASEHGAEAAKGWLEGAYLLDPFYSLFTNNSPGGIYPLSELAPDNFYESDFFLNYFKAMDHCEECGVLINLNQDHSILISLGSKEIERTSLQQRANLQTVLPVLSELCRRQQSAAEGEINFSAPLDKAFRNFGKDHLSARECEVIQLILKGHSNKSIAQLLDISIDTVKVYNKRYHAKLEIGSQAELFSLFLEAISLVPFDVDIDPLTHYFEISRR